MTTQIDQKQSIKTLLAVGLFLVGIGLVAALIITSSRPMEVNVTCSPVVSNEAVGATINADELNAKTQQLKVSVAEYQRQPGLQQHKKILTYAQARKQAVGKALMAGLEIPVESMVTATETDLLARLTKNCFEQPFQGQGELRKIHADNFDQRTSVNLATLVTDTTSQTLYLAPWLNTIQSGSVINLTGVMLDNQLFATATGNIEQQPLSVDIISPAKWPVEIDGARQGVLTLLANFSTTNATSPTRSNLAAMFDNLAGVQAYYLENSYGQLEVQADVRDWMTVPGTSAACTGDPNAFSYPGFAEAALNRAMQIDPSIVLANYSHLVVIAPYTCGWGGVATGTQTLTVGGTSVTYQVELIKNTVASVDTISHEYGHDLTADILLDHANFRNCVGLTLTTPTCPLSEYGDPFDVMGGALSGQIRNNPSHFNAHHKLYAGWLESGDIITVPEAVGVYQYTLRPIENPPNPLFPHRIAAVAMRSTSLWPVYIEYRQPIGFDSRMLPAAVGDVFDGALIHVGPNLVNFTGGLYSAGDNTLAPGQVLRDPNACNGPASDTTCNTITVTSRTSAELGIRIDIRKDVVRPQASIIAPSSGSQAQGQITVKAEAQDGSGIQRVDFYTFFNNTMFASVTSPDINGQYSATLDTTRLPNGANSLYVRAYDRAGNSVQSQPPVSITVTNTDPAPPSQVMIISPTAGSVVRSPVTFAATAVDNVGIWKIEFIGPGLCGQICPFDSQPPFAITTPISDGTKTVYAKAYDFVGNTLSTQIITYTVDTIPPVVAITAPLNGATVSDILSITANATDTSGIDRVEFFIGNGDGATLLGTDMTGPYSFSWNTRTVSNGLHLLSAKAFDRAGNATISTTVSVNVSNAGGGGEPSIIRRVIR